jgi:anti-sigma factor RsiW
MGGEAYTPEMLEKYYRLRGRRRAEAQRPKPREEPREEPREDEREEDQPCGADAWIGRHVRIVLRNGQVFEGQIHYAWKYELLLDIGKKKIDIFKHAIEYIELLD